MPWLYSPSAMCVIKTSRYYFRKNTTKHIPYAHQPILTTISHREESNPPLAEFRDGWWISNQKGSGLRTQTQQKGSVIQTAFPCHGDTMTMWKTGVEHMGLIIRFLFCAVVPWRWHGNSISATCSHTFYCYIDGLMQMRRNSRASIMELPLFCRPEICGVRHGTIEQIYLEWIYLPNFVAFHGT